MVLKIKSWIIQRPAFFEAIDGAVKRNVDKSFFQTRTEIVCANCDGHLGHVFKGEGFGGKDDERHCVNSVSMTFKWINSWLTIYYYNLFLFSYFIDESYNYHSHLITDDEQPKNGWKGEKHPKDKTISYFSGLQSRTSVSRRPYSQILKRTLCWINSCRCKGCCLFGRGSRISDCRSSWAGRKREQGAESEAYNSETFASKMKIIWNDHSSLLEATKS